jgi:RHO1 GDP-GTP exchange protein 1/2
MLAALFSRQREQHPLVQSVTDIILDGNFDLPHFFSRNTKTCPPASLLFRSDYETYIKSYPLAEARHRSELKKNSNYREWLQKCYRHPQVRRRDLITFISRPVTRLPRLCLLLEGIRKLTDSRHPDNESLPLLIGILNDFVKSTQPGIAAAEGKVKFWNLCESLVYAKGEIMVCPTHVTQVSMVNDAPRIWTYTTKAGPWSTPAHWRGA